MWKNFNILNYSVTEREKAVGEGHPKEKIDRFKHSIRRVARAQAIDSGRDTEPVRGGLKVIRGKVRSESLLFASRDPL